MSGALALGVAFVAGAALGAFYFGTLWLVVRRLPRVRRPAAWLGVTGLLRLAVVLACFALLVGPRWERLVVALIGFLAVRVILTRRLGRPAEPGARSERDRSRPMEERGDHQPG
jgi:F1F0 ATPase subunit 2